MRILLFTGKGGVGKTSVAAATALAASRAGIKTLVTSTDPAHSLADAFDKQLGDEPGVLGPGLWGQQIDAQRRLEENWREIRDYATDLLEWTGMRGIEAEEMAVIPGLDEVFALSDLKTHHDEGAFDLLVVDCAPTAETLRLLSLPEIMAWYIERIFPVNRKIVKAVRPVLSRMPGLPPIASDDVFMAVERFYRKIEGIREVLTDPVTTSVRLVVNPEKMVIAEGRRTYTYLSLFQYRVDAVIANRLIPDQVSDPYFDRWKTIQAEHMNTIHESFDPVPILTAPLFDREMVGAESLELLASEIYGALDPNAVLYEAEPFRIVKHGNGWRLRVRLPFAGSGEVDLSRSSGELIVKVGSMKRTLLLPDSLRSAQVGGAKFDGDWLVISFDEHRERGESPEQDLSRVG